MLLSVDSSNYEAAMNSSWSTPIFLLLFSKMCSHCHHMRPAWDNMSSMYAGNPGIQIAEVDCWSNYQICQKFAIKGYPSFYWIHGDERGQIETQRTTEAFSSRAESILQRPAKVKPNFLDTSSPEYPYFVFRLGRTASLADLHLADLVKQVPKQQGMIYIDDERALDYTSLVSCLTSTKDIRYKGDGSILDLASFIKEYYVNPLSEISIEEAKELTRPVVFIVSDDKQKVTEFRTLANKMYEHVLLAFMPKEKAQELIPSLDVVSDDLPMLLQFSKDFTRYRDLRKITTGDRMKQFLYNSGNQQLRYKPVSITPNQIFDYSVLPHSFVTFSYLLMAFISLFIVWRIWVTKTGNKTE